MEVSSLLLAFQSSRRLHESGCAPRLLGRRAVRLVEEPTLVGDHYRLGAVTDLELLQDPRDGVLTVVSLM